MKVQTKLCEAACLFWRGTENPIAFEDVIPEMILKERDMIFKVEARALSS